MRIIGLIVAFDVTETVCTMCELEQSVFAQVEAVPSEHTHVVEEVVVRPVRCGSTLRIEVTDNGRGLPDDFQTGNTSSLGLSIVETLVSDLHGQFELGPNPDGPGARAVVEVPVG